MCEEKSESGDEMTYALSKIVDKIIIKIKHIPIGTS